MFKSYGLKVVAGAIALTLAGAAIANTSLDGTTTGDLFLNIVDTTNSTSFLFDTGVSQASFNGAVGSSFNLGTDANLATFLNGTDTFNYSVISATKSGSASTLDFTGGANVYFPVPATPSAFILTQVQATVGQFLTFANTVASTTNNSAILPTGSGAEGFWGSSLSEGSLSAKLFKASQTPYADNAPLGTPLSFFQGVGSTVTTFAGQWDFSATGDILSYVVQTSSGGSSSGGSSSGGSSSGGGTPPLVPLPPSLLLLLSGLGLIGGSIARRGRIPR